MSDTGPEVVLTAGAANVRYRGRLLYSERGPALSARRGAEAVDLGPGRLYLLASPLLWHGAADLLSRLEEGSAILGVEAEADLQALAAAHLPTDLAASGRVALSPAPTPEAVLEAALALGRFRQVILVRLSGGEAFHRDYYAALARQLQGEFTARWRSQTTLMAMGRLWTRNIFRNLSALGTDLLPRPLPRPAGAVAVCGAGPSLEGSLAFLAEAQERGLLSIWACDTALGSLVEAGIRPDLVVCLEGQAHNLPDFIPAAGSGLALLGDLSSHPRSFTALGGPTCLSAVDIAPSAFLRRVRRSLAEAGIPFVEAPPLGSVGVHALHLARAACAGGTGEDSKAGIGGGPVLVTGLDFAFRPGKTHARGSPSLLGEGRRLSRLHRWPGQIAASFRPQVSRLGGDDLTDPVLRAYGALCAEEALSPGPTVYDIRHGGLSLGLESLGEAAAWNVVSAASMPGTSRAPDGSAPLSGARAKGTSLPEVGARREGTAAGEAFLKAELEALVGLEACLRTRGEAGRSEIASRARSLDYLLWPFPDGDRIEALPQDLLNRLLVETEGWIWRLEELRRATAERT